MKLGANICTFKNTIMLILQTDLKVGNYLYYIKIEFCKIFCNCPLRGRIKKIEVSGGGISLDLDSPKCKGETNFIYGKNYIEVEKYGYRSESVTRFVSKDKFSFGIKVKDDRMGLDRFSVTNHRFAEKQHSRTSEESEVFFNTLNSKTLKKRDELWNQFN